MLLNLPCQGGHGFAVSVVSCHVEGGLVRELYKSVKKACSTGKSTPFAIQNTVINDRHNFEMTRIR